MWLIWQMPMWLDLSDVDSLKPYKACREKQSTRLGEMDCNEAE
jgi:hypothetical protein